MGFAQTPQVKSDRVPSSDSNRTNLPRIRQGAVITCSYYQQEYVPSMLVCLPSNGLASLGHEMRHWLAGIEDDRASLGSRVELCQ